MKDEFQDQLEEILEELSGTTDEFIYRRINRPNFARVVFWICVRGRNDEFVTSRDLAEFMKVTTQRAYYQLQDLCRVGLLKKDCKSSSMAWYWLLRDDFGVYKINKYFQTACKTLGIKNKLVIDEGEKMQKVKERMKR